MLILSRSLCKNVACLLYCHSIHAYCSWPVALYFAVEGSAVYLEATYDDMTRKSTPMPIFLLFKGS